MVRILAKYAEFPLFYNGKNCLKSSCIRNPDPDLDYFQNLMVNSLSCDTSVDDFL